MRHLHLHLINTGKSVLFKAESINTAETNEPGSRVTLFNGKVYEVVESVNTIEGLLRELDPSPVGVLSVERMCDNAEQFCQRRSDESVQMLDAKAEPPTETRADDDDEGRATMRVLSVEWVGSTYAAAGVLQSIASMIGDAETGDDPVDVGV